MSNFNKFNKDLDSKNLFRVNKYKLIKDYKSLARNIDKIKEAERSTNNLIFTNVNGFKCFEQFDFDIYQNIDNSLYQIQTINNVEILKFYYIKLKIIRELLNKIFANIKLLDFNKLNSFKIFTLANIMYKLYYYTYIQKTNKNTETLTDEINKRVLKQIFIILNFNRTNTEKIINDICLSLKEQKDIMYNRLNKELDKVLTKKEVLKVRDRVINFDIFHNYFNKNKDIFIKETEFIDSNVILKMKLDGNVLNFTYEYYKDSNIETNKHIVKLIESLTEENIKLRFYIGSKISDKYIEAKINYTDTGVLYYKNKKGIVTTYEQHRNNYSFNFDCSISEFQKYLEDKDRLWLYVINKINGYFLAKFLYEARKFGQTDLDFKEDIENNNYAYPDSGIISQPFPLGTITVKDLRLE